MKNLSQISDNKDIITKEYLVAGYEPLLPATERTNLTAITALSTNGFIKRTGAGTYAIDLSTYALSTHNHNGTYQPLDADLTSIAGLTGITGLLRKTAANTWALDEPVQIKRW